MKRKHLLIAIGLLSMALICLLGLVALRMNQPQDPTLSTSGTTSGTTVAPTTQATVPSTAEPTVTDPPTEPTEPPIIKESTATVGATGDMLLHDKVIRGGYDPETDTFDYSYMFTHFSRYTSMVDYAVANLEVTLICKPGTDGLKGYNGYPNFNAPDEIVDALGGAGFDMLLTANNHSYDSRHDGFVRTQEVIADKGLAHIGTRPTAEDKPYTIVEVNGIRIGMINYTYNTGIKDNGSVSLNTIPLTVEDSALINTFSYAALEDFYAELQGHLEAMEAEGAEALVLYIHWGDEYHTYANDNQKKMAQRLCNLGIDVIVGNHAHVPQPVVLLTSEEDEAHKTLCLYSTGNSVSNIHGSSTRPANTEDGMLFQFTFAKYSDGTVVLESADILPTWVLRYDDEKGVRKFLILTLDREIDDWKTELGISDETLAQCEESYDRTMGIVGEGLEEANAYFAQNQAQIEAELGIE